MQTNYLNEPAAATPAPTPTTPSQKRRRYLQYDREPSLINLTQGAEFDKRVPGPQVIDEIRPDINFINNARDVFNQIVMARDPAQGQEVALGFIPRPFDQGGPAWPEMGNLDLRDWASQNINAVLAGLGVDAETVVSQLPIQFDKGKYVVLAQ